MHLKSAARQNNAPTHVTFELAAYDSTITQQPAAARSITVFMNVFMYLLFEDQSHSTYTLAHRPVWSVSNAQQSLTTGVSRGGMQSTANSCHAICEVSLTPACEQLQHVHTTENITAVLSRFSR